MAKAINKMLRFSHRPPSLGEGAPVGHERWLPSEAAKPGDLYRYSPWVPQTLVGLIDPGELGDMWAYVVVDEIVGDRIGLSVARWPRLDERSRLWFTDPSEDELLGTPRESFGDFVRRHRVVLVMTPAGELDREAGGALREREVRIGDVFAIPRSVIVESADRSGGRELEASGDVRVYDISYEAREQAKLAGAAAVAPPLDDEEARRFLGEEGPDGDAPRGDGPDDEGPGGSRPPEQPKPVGAGPGGEMVVPAEQVAELET